MLAVKNTGANVFVALARNILLSKVDNFLEQRDGRHAPQQQSARYSAAGSSRSTRLAVFLGLEAAHLHAGFMNGGSGG
jgi:hypothetical protein